MPIVPKITAVGACARYAIDTVLPYLGYFEYRILGIEVNRPKDPTQPYRTVHVTAFDGRTGRNLRIEVVALRRTAKVPDDRWYPCIMRIKLGNDSWNYFRIYLEKTSMHFDLMPEIIGYRQLSRGKRVMGVLLHDETAPAELLDISQSLKSHRKKIKLKYRAIPPSAY